MSKLLMDDQFAQKLDNFYRNLDTLLQNPALKPGLDEDIAQARKELHSFVENLHTAMEELNRHNEELQDARSRIEAERSRYRDLFEFAPDGYLITDKHATVQEANQTVAEMLNVPAQYLIGKPLATYIHPEDRSEFRARLARALLEMNARGERVERWELRLKPRHGEPFYALLIIGIPRRPVYHLTRKRAADQIVVRWMLHDITERRQAQEVLLRVQEELEQRVRERTEELSGAYLELHQIADQLEARNKELQDFAFIASHDLQEPLRKVRAFADTLITRAQDPTSTDYLERMRAAAVRMQVMLDGLLVYARVTSQGRSMEPTDLNEVCREVVSDLELRVQQSQAQVELAPLPVVTADPLQIYRLIQNLLANAIKFHSPDRPPVVKVSGEVDGDFVILRVSDNGVGFDLAHLDRLFQPFSRLHGRSQFEGTGMGLAICRKIVERHGGSITAESAPGQGATFIVALPRPE